MYHINMNHTRIYGSFTRTIVWTPWARGTALYTHVRKHIDSHFVTRQRTITYKRPLVVQLFPQTEKSKRMVCILP